MFTRLLVARGDPQVGSSHSPAVGPDRWSPSPSPTLVAITSGSGSLSWSTVPIPPPVHSHNSARHGTVVPRPASQPRPCCPSTCLTWTWTKPMHYKAVGWHHMAPSGPSNGGVRGFLCAPATTPAGHLSGAGPRPQRHALSLPLLANQAGHRRCLCRAWMCLLPAGPDLARPVSVLIVMRWPWSCLGL